MRAMAYTVICLFCFLVCFLHTASAATTASICTINTTTTAAVTAGASTSRSSLSCASAGAPATPLLRCSISLSATSTNHSEQTATVLKEVASCTQAAEGSTPKEDITGRCRYLFDSFSPSAHRPAPPSSETVDVRAVCSAAAAIANGSKLWERKYDAAGRCAVTTPTSAIAKASSTSCHTITAITALPSTRYISDAAINCSTLLYTDAAGQVDSTVCSIVTLLKEGRARLAISDTTTNCTTTTKSSMTSEVVVSHAFTVCFIDTSTTTLSNNTHHDDMFKEDNLLRLMRSFPA